jgi:hypothetical protein
MRDYSKDFKVKRRVWAINPKERVVTSKKEYNRQDAKKEVKEVVSDELNEEAYDFDVDYYNDIY